MSGRKDRKWIQDTHMEKGALHEALSIPQDKKIPMKAINKATHSQNPTLKKEAVLAKTLKKISSNR